VSGQELDVSQSEKDPAPIGSLITGTEPLKNFEIMSIITELPQPAPAPR